MKKPLSRVFLSIFILSQIILPNVNAYWSDTNPGMTVPAPAPTEYISCPTDHAVTDSELAGIIGVTIDELTALKTARTLSNSDICQLSKAKLRRALKKAKDPSQNITDFITWREKSLTSADGKINSANIAEALQARQGLLTGNQVSFFTKLFSDGQIDKQKWHELGPSNVSGRIITLLADPDVANTLYAGSAGGGLWISHDR